MYAFVSGASGFLGQHLCRTLESSGWKVDRPSSRECDLTREGSLAPWSQHHYDRIFHLAAWTQAGDFCLNHPGEQWLINQSINTRILDWWKQTQPQAKLIAIGTSCSYDPNLSLIEDNYLQGSPIKPLFTYAMTKRMLYTGLLALNQQFGLRYLQVIPSTLYGPDYHNDGRQMHFIFDLIRKLLRGKLYGDGVTLWGDGFQRREVIHVNDFVDTLVKLDVNIENETINIGSGKELAIREFASLICKIIDFPEERIKYDSSRYVGAKSKCLDITKLMTLCPGFQKIQLDEGLKTTIDWFLKQRKTIFQAHA